MLDLRRARYLWRRAQESGGAALAAKLAQKVRPYVYWPLYSRREFIAERPIDIVRLREFGTLNFSAFRTLAEVDPERCHRAARRAELALGENFEVLGYGGLRKPSGVSWHCDDLHSYAWEPRYFARCDFVAAGKRCDVKIPWELSRLQWLVWLAEASVHATEGERTELAERFVATVKDWAEANPAGYGVNWAVGMEVAIRATNLAVSASVFSLQLDDATVGDLAALLRAHLIFLGRFPEISDVPGNHYLCDLMGEAVLHVALDGLRSYQAQRAFRALAIEADRQFEEEGCHLERATIYHRLALDMILVPCAFALRAGDPAAADLQRIIQRAAKYMASIASDQGELPVFGDQDSGFVLWFGERAQSADGRFVGLPEAKNTDLHSFLAAVADDERYFPTVERKCAASSPCGFATLRAGRVQVTMKTGAQGLAGRAPHDHDDGLSVVAFWQGEPLIVDPGCHSYTLDPEHRLRSILSSRHNAVVPIGLERFRPVEGSVNATIRGAPTASLTRCNDGEMLGELEAPDAAGLSCWRRVRVDNGLVEIEDRWKLDRQQGVGMLWLFHPAWRIEGLDDFSTFDGSRIAFRVVGGERVILASLAGENLRVIRCRENYSPAYGCYEECYAVRVETGGAVSGRSLLRLAAAV